MTDPKDATAATFYQKFGFRPLDERRMFVAMHEIERWLSDVTND